MCSDKVRNEIIKNEKREIRIYDHKIEEVTERMTEMGICTEKAKAELKIMIMMGVLMNRLRSQEIKED
jgi:hypothetical protein